MRINLIGNFGSAGLNQDASLLRGLLVNQFGDSLSIHRVTSNQPECPEAELNIFLEIVNPCLISYAGYNVWIPNQDWTYQTWIPYVAMMDSIWVKTREAEKIFSQWTKNVRYIGWTSIDKVYEPKKNYSKAIVLVGKNPYRNPKALMKAYYHFQGSDPVLFKNLPELHIPHNKEEVPLFVPPEIQSKVFLYDTLTESEYDKLLHECGLAICLSNCEGFGHAVNEAMSAGCNLILSQIEPFLEMTEESQDVLWAIADSRMKHPTCTCELVDTYSSSLRACLIEWVDTDASYRKKISEHMRTMYEKHHRKFIEQFKCPEVASFDGSKCMLNESELPDVSIVTLVYNRPEFMPLAKYSYLIQSYPEDKLEWVIVDDGDSIEEELMGIPNVKYVRLDKKTGIAEKRNIGVQNAMYNTIVFMDDDDVYPNNSVLQRVAMMNRFPKKECVFSTIIPCYDIERYTSFMNVPPITLPMSQRVSEATLCFTKKFWEASPFTDDIGEADTFIRGREHMCREISPQEVIVSLVHSKNTSSRKTPQGEPNGCHYGFNEKLYALVSQIGEGLKAHAE
jgi:hypothetical protein